MSEFKNFFTKYKPLKAFQEYEDYSHG